MVIDFVRNFRLTVRRHSMFFEVSFVSWKRNSKISETFNVNKINYLKIPILVSFRRKEDSEGPQKAGKDAFLWLRRTSQKQKMSYEI